MPLLKNTFQPFFPDPDNPMPRVCAGSYCYPINAGDITGQQWYQTPCAGNLVCDPEFEENTLGPELITNGNFDTNADDWFVNAVEVGSTACPTTVDGWCFNTNRLGHDGTGSDSDMVSQTGMGLAAGNVYRVVWTVQGRTQGNIYVQLGDGVGATQGTIQEDNGTFTEFLFYNDAQDTISFVPSEDFDGNIDSISLMLVTMDCWTGDFWTFDTGEGFAAKTESGVQGNLINTIADYIVSGDYYQVQVTVQGIVSGSVVLYIDDGTDSTATNPQTAITSNGTYTYWITASQDGVIAFDPSLDFIGQIFTPVVQRLRNDYIFNLINPEGDSIPMSSNVEYYEDKVTLYVDWSEMLEAGTIDFGCHTIQITDTCLVSGDNLVQDGNFSNGDFSEWTANAPAWQLNMAGGEIQFIFDPLSDSADLTTNGDFSGGSTGWTVGAGWSIAAGQATHTPGNTASLSQTITLTAPVGTQLLRAWFQVEVTGRTAGSFTVTIGDKTSGAYTQNDTITFFLAVTVYGAQTISINPTTDFDGVIELVAAHESFRAWNPNPQMVNAANTSIVAGTYQIDFDITAVSGPGIYQGGFGLIQPAFPTIEFGAGAKSHQQVYTPGNQVITIGGWFQNPNANIYYPGTVNIDNYSVVRVEPFEATYESECLNFQESHPNTTLVTGWCDRDALGSTFEDALGFESTDFVLQMRIECRSLNADVDVEAVLAKFSDGNSEVKYAQFEKFWQFVTAYISESASTTLAAMAHCDHFTIGDAGIAATQYTVVVERITPQWLQDGSYELAPVLLTIRKKTGGMKFNRHT